MDGWFKKLNILYTLHNLLPHKIFTVFFGQNSNKLKKDLKERNHKIWQRITYYIWSPAHGARKNRYLVAMFY